MPIVYRYLLRNFFQALVIFYVTFTGLYVVIDAFGNLEEFINHGKEAGGLLVLVARYYGVRSLVLLDRTSGVLTLIAAMFTLTALERHNELTALMAAGVSRGRLARPIIGGVIAVSLLAVANRELVIPQFRQQLATNAQDFERERGQPVKPQYDYQTDVFLNGRLVFLTEQRLHRPAFRLPSQLARYSTQIVAQDAIFHEAGQGRPAGYLLKQISHPSDLSEASTIRLDGRPVIFFPSDTPWLNDGECFLASDVHLEQIAGGSNWQRLSSTVELIGALRNPSTEFGPDVRVAVHARLVQPLLDIVLLFLGLPLVLARESRNIFVAIGMCLGVVFCFFVVKMACHALGNNCLISPAAAAWAPLALSVPAAVLLSAPLQE